MRTVFVNPTPKKKRRNSTALARVPNALLAAPRRRNAGIAPFVAASNPLILQNPKRRRRRRRNPAPNVNTMLKRTVEYGGGSAVGTAVNVLALNRIPNMWLRNGSRIVAAVFGGMLLKNLSGNDHMAAAAAGSTMYPLWQEVMSQVLTGTGAAAATSDELDMLAADLEDVLSEVDQADLVDDYNTIMR